MPRYILLQTVLIGLVLEVTAVAAQSVSNNLHPSLSPDGRRIVFESDRDGNAEIYLMDADGSDVARLTRHPAQDTGPVWSEDGSVILFRSNREGRYPQVYRMNPDGTHVERFAHPEQMHRVWSPDRRMALTGPEKRGDNNIYIMNADGAERRPLTTFDAGSVNSNMSFSPDGTRVLYESFVGNATRGEIFIVDIDGANKTRLTNGTDPSWSPDGSRVLYKVHTEENKYFLHVINADGTGKRMLGEGTHPRFFPDGKRILFMAPVGDGWQVFVMGITDGRRVQLTP